MAAPKYIIECQEVKEKGTEMMKESTITITAQKLQFILNTLDEQRNAEAEYAEAGNTAMRYFCEGQANGIEFVLAELGIAF